MDRLPVIPNEERLSLRDRVAKFSHVLLGHVLRNSQVWTGQPNTYEQRQAGLQELEEFANAEPEA